MILLQDSGDRQSRHNLWLGGSTAIAAGLVNVASVMAFFAFSSNVTGHASILSEELVKGHWHQVSVVAGWLLMFVLGAFSANMLVSTLGYRNRQLGHATPLLIEMVVLVGVAYYGHHHYAETLRETEILVAALVLAMGMQNGLVATVSSYVVKTTHLTGLFTDLGIELSMFLQQRYRRDENLRFKLRLRLTILGGYMVGGIVGGLIYLTQGLKVIYGASLILALILVHDLILLRLVQRRESLAAASQQGELPG